jgi:hypothetical protein
MSTTDQIAQITRLLNQFASTLPTHEAALLRADLAALSNSVNSANRSIGAFSNEAMRGARAIASSTASFAGSLGKGQTAISSISGIITAMSGSLADVISAIPQLGVAGKFAGAAIETMGKAAAYTTGVLDDGLGSFQELSRVGGIGSDSIAGLAKDIHAAGIPLKMFSGLIAGNSKQLAALQGTTSDARSEFANVMGGMRKGMNKELRKIGFTTEEISETVINFADLQRRLGRGQRLDSVQLQERTQQYAKELDKVSRLTGMQREEQQKLVDAAMREGRWRATIEDLHPGQVMQMNILNNSMSAFSDEMASGLRDQASGFTQSDAAQKLFRTTNGASVEIMEKVKSGQLSAHDAMIAFQEAVTANKSPMKALNQAVGDSAGVYVRYNQSMDLITANFNDLGDAVKHQQKQMGADSDPTTKALVSLQVALQQASASITATLMNSPNVASTLDSAGEKFVVGTNLFYDTFKGDFFTDATPKRPATESEVSLQDLNIERRKLLIEKANLNVPPTHKMKMAGIENPLTPEETARSTAIDKRVDEINIQIKKLNAVIKTETEKRTDSVSAILKQMGIEKTERESLFTPLPPLQSSINALLEKDHDILSDTITKAGGAQIKALLDQATTDGVDINKDSKLWQKIYEVIRETSESTGMFSAGKIEVVFPDEIKVLPGTTPIDVNVIEKSSHAVHSSPEMVKGGVLSGPKSGYNVTMHGTEAVVPLPDKKGIPVNVQAGTSNNKHIELLEKQVNKLTAVVKAIEDNTSISNKILRVTQN